MRLPTLTPILVLCAAALLAGCEQLGIETADVAAARRDSEGKAIGAGCRHAARSVEQCYATNKKADKAAVFAGWREMNDYMRENQIEPMPEPPPAVVAVAPVDGETEADGDDTRPGDASRAGGDTGRNGRSDRRR